MKCVEPQRTEGMEQIQGLANYSVSLEWYEQCRVKPGVKFVRGCLGLYPEHNRKQERDTIRNVLQRSSLLAKIKI